jgi:hypothetical protein
MEAFGLNQVLAHDAESGSAGLVVSVGGCAASIRRRSREEPDRAIGEDAIYVEEDEFDFFCARAG